MQKELLEVGNKKMEVIRGGLEVPKVVILPGMSSSAYEWEQVVQHLEPTISYLIVHRAGCGNSELGEESRTTAATIQELDALLQWVGVDSPFVLVGHSYGGLCAQHYARVFPDKVSAVVLADSTSVDLEKLNAIETSSPEDTDEYWIRKCIQYAAMKPEQLADELYKGIDAAHDNLSEVAQFEIMQFTTSPNLYRAMASEIENWEECGKRIKETNAFPQVPLFIIARDPHYQINQAIQQAVPEEEAKAFEEMWQQLIAEQVKLSSRSTVLCAENSSHSIHLDRPDLIARVIIACIDTIPL